MDVSLGMNALLNGILSPFLIFPIHFDISHKSSRTLLASICIIIIIAVVLIETC